MSRIQHRFLRITTTMLGGLLSALIATTAQADEPATLWLQHQRLAIGLGLSLTPATMLTWETDAQALSGTAGSAQRLGLSFQNRNADGDVKGLFRVQLSSQSVLQWRPRKDGLRITYKATF
jgi:hypothetical protein